MEKTLDFKVVFYLLRKKAVWIILATVIGAISAFLFTDNMIPKTYKSSAEVYISNTQDSSKVSGADLSASRTLADTYCVILQSVKSMSTLSDMLLNNEEYQKCSNKTSYSISVSPTDETEVLKITVTSRDPELSKVVCNTMLEVSKVLISDIFDGAGKASPLGDATANYTPASPNLQSNTMMGALLGFVLISVIVVFWEMLDNRVKDEADFVSKVNIPVLGEVPSINDESEEKEGYYYYAYTKKEENN